MSLTTEQRSALELLAGARHGAVDAVLIVNGFETEMLAGLVLAGLATVVTETVKAGARPTKKVGRYTITDNGRQALLDG